MSNEEKGTGKLLERKNFAKAARNPEFMKRLIETITGYDIDVKEVDIIHKDGTKASGQPIPDVIVHTTQGTIVEIVLPESISKEYLERKGFKEKEEKKE